MKLMIVESPHKAQVIRGFLPRSDYIVEASVGHIRELPDAKRMSKAEKEKYTDYAIDVNNGFEALYKVDTGKTAVVKKLRDALAKCDELILATDPDREGECIAWHLLELLSPEVKRNNLKVSRCTWQEITKEAIQEGLRNKGSINMHEVDAALARSHYDRLFGYSISPVLWRTVGPGTSGGRVQSPVLRLVVNREKERLAFVKAEYMMATGSFAISGSPLIARLISLGERNFATGNSFDGNGKLKGNDMVINRDNWPKLESALKRCTYAVSDVSTRPYTRNAPPPYTTSSFQQDVGTRLAMSTKQIMNIAQRLYEAGLTTYLRTDSVTLSQEAIGAARSDAKKMFGAGSVPAKPNVHKNKGKNAQEAHEALRPAVVNNSFQTPAQLKGQLDKIDKNAFKVYQCIYNRTIASQMNPAKGITTTVKISSQGTAPEKTFTFATSATVFTEPGWTALTKPISEGEEDNTLDSKVEMGESAELRKLEATSHATTPPPRWTEPKLVQALSDLGIGRPATYASMVTVNQTRGYVEKKGQQLYPTWKGFKIAQYLEKYTPEFVAYDATATMEEELDKIEDGSLSKNAFLSREWNRIQGEVLPLAGSVNWDEVNAVGMVPVNEEFAVRVNSYGAWLERLSDPLDEKGYRKGVSLGDNDTVASMDFTDVAQCRELFEKASNRPGPRELGVLTSGPYEGWTVSARDGRYGAFLQAVHPKNTKEKPINNPLPDGVELADVTMEQAQEIYGEVKLPRWSPDGKWLVGIGKRGPYMGFKSTAKARPRFQSLEDGMDPRTVEFDAVKKLWEEKEAAKGETPAKEAAPKKAAAPRKAATAKKATVKKTAPRKKA